MHGLAFVQDCLNDLQEERRGANQVIHGEVEQNQIHGLMQRFVQNDHTNEDEVAEEDDHVAQGGKEKCGKNGPRWQMKAVQL